MKLLQKSFTLRVDEIVSNNACDEHCGCDNEDRCGDIVCSCDVSWSCGDNDSCGCNH